MRRRLARTLALVAVAGTCGTDAVAATLAGVVRDADGTPVEGAAIAATGAGTVTGATDADGRYALTVSPDHYRVYALPPSASGLAPAWAPGAPERCGGAAIDVPDEAASIAVDVAVAPGGAVTGLLRRPDGSAAGGVTLNVVSNLVDARVAVTDPDGGFDVGGIAPGDVAIAVIADGLPVQFVGGAFVATEVIPVPVSAGELVALGPVDLRPGTTIRGRVTAGGAPATTGTVSAYAPSMILDVPIGPDAVQVPSGLPPGDTTAWATVDGWATTWLGDVDRPGTFVPVADGEVRDGFDLTLPPASAIVGVLSGPVTDWSAVPVSAINDDGSVGVAAEVEPNGAFRIDGLYAGSYSLSIGGAASGVVDGTWAPG
ncbi:MAG: carboxypeptidase regulatory-like domain-containing protein, partial [Myxococcota bacterium]